MLSLRSNLLLLRGIITSRNPLYVQFALSNRCVLDCGMCGISESRRGEEELDLRDIGRIVDILKALKVAVVVLTGGEPLMREDLPQIIRLFDRAGMYVRLQTRGVTLNEGRAGEIIDAGLKEVTISIDSLNAGTQDYICGRSGAWEEIMRGIWIFSKTLPRRNNLSGLNVVISRFNLKEIIDIVRFGTDIGFYVSLIPVHISSGTEGKFVVRGKDRRFLFDNRDHDMIDRVCTEVLEMKKRGYLIQNSRIYLEGLPDFLKGLNRPKWVCRSPEVYFSVTPDGYFAPCADFETNIPILEGDFYRLYHSVQFKEQIKNLVNSCPGCFYACYPDLVYLQSHPSVIFERINQSWRLLRRKRTIFKYDELIILAHNYRKNHTNQPFVPWCLSG